MQGEKFEIAVTEGQVDLLQRYGYEYDTRCDIVARIVSRASSTEELDEGALIYYQRLADESKAMFEAAKAEFGKSVVKPQVEARYSAGMPFSWNIPSYADLRCVVWVG